MRCGFDDDNRLTCVIRCAEKKLSTNDAVDFMGEMGGKGDTMLLIQW